jgi:hypothetical protein
VAAHLAPRHRTISRTVNRKATGNQMNNMKRMRGRQNRPGNGGGGGGPAPIRHQGGNIPLNRNHSFDSSGPDVRVRGTAQQLFEKYLQLGRDATSGGDRVMAESYFQHAEHYFRILNAMNQAVQGNQNNQGGQYNGQRRYGDNEAAEGEEQNQDETAEAPQQQNRPDNRNENRPYENRRGNDGNQQRYEPREPRVEPQLDRLPGNRVEPQLDRLPGTGDQPDAREIPIAAAPPEG